MTPQDRIIDFRYLVTQPDLNAHGTLHGGILIKWADESAGMHARKVTKGVCVTRCVDRINFVQTARAGDVIKITSRLAAAGKTSLTFSSTIKNDITGEMIATIDRLIFVFVDGNHNPVPHQVKIDV